MTQIYWSQLLNNNYIAIGEKRRIMNESYMQRINENYWKNKSEFWRFVCLKKSIDSRKKIQLLRDDAYNCSLSNIKDSFLC